MEHSSITLGCFGVSLRSQCLKATKQILLRSPPRIFGSSPPFPEVQSKQSSHVQFIGSVSILLEHCNQNPMNNSFLEEYRMNAERQEYEPAIERHGLLRYARRKHPSPDYCHPRAYAVSYATPNSNSQRILLTCYFAMSVCIGEL